MVTLRDTLELAFRSAIQQLDPAVLTLRHAQGLDQHQQHVLVAVGKAAPAMARGVLASGLPLARALVITTDGTPADDLEGPMTVLRASHPIPDARSLEAAEIALETARSTGSCPLVVHVSGGASSLLCAPVIGMTLDDKQRLTNALLRSGASIQEVNTVRRHLSRIKGGRLAAACAAEVHTAILSDVIDGAPHDVASGPACVDPTTCDQAARVLGAYLPPAHHGPLLGKLRESVKPGDPVAARIFVDCLCGPMDLAQQVARNLLVHDVQARVESVRPQSAASFSRWLVDRARKLAPGSACVVASEPSLQLPEHAGKGGRAGWVALAALASLPPGTALLAGASDGVDGCSASAGACVTADMQSLANPAEVQQALHACDDAAVHAQLGSHLRGEPTGVNLTDVYVVARQG